MIGSTDSHTGLATAEEDNFFGKHSGAEPNADRINHPMAKTANGQYDGWAMVASGLRGGLGEGEYARVDLRRDDAQGDVRDDGPADCRTLLRGMEIRPRRCEHALARPGRATTKGVPMGGDLKAAPAGKSADGLPRRGAEGLDRR